MPKFKNLTGKMFGKLTVLSDYKIINKRIHWLCECECKQQKFISSNSLMTGKTNSCGCIRKNVLRNKNFVDLSNTIKGQLKVTGQYYFKNRTTYWFCICSCGTELWLSSRVLMEANRKSCGCLSKKYANEKIGSRIGTRIISTDNKLSKTVKSRVDALLRRNKSMNEYECDICNNKENIQLHHLYSINNKPELALEKDNLIPLCVSHHSGFHTSFGYGMNTPLQYLEYKNILKQLEVNYKRG